MLAIQRIVTNRHARIASVEWNISRSTLTRYALACTMSLSLSHIWLGTHRTMFFVTALLVGLNGYWGGVMVYGPEQHQWPETPSAHSH